MAIRTEMGKYIVLVQVLFLILFDLKKRKLYYILKNAKQKISLKVIK